MGLKLIVQFIAIFALINATAAVTKDLYMGRTFVPRAATAAETFRQMRANGVSPIQQLLYIILTPIQTVIVNALSAVCSISNTVLNLVGTLRQGIFGVIVQVLAGINIFPFTLLLNAATAINGTLTTIGGTLKTTACSATDGATNVVNSLVDAIIGIF